MGTKQDKVAHIITNLMYIFFFASRDSQYTSVGCAANFFTHSTALTIFVTLLWNTEALLSFNEESQTYKKKENLTFRLKSGNFLYKFERNLFARREFFPLALYTIPKDDCFGAKCRKPRLSNCFKAVWKDRLAVTWCKFCRTFTHPVNLHSAPYLSSFPSFYSTSGTFRVHRYLLEISIHSQVYYMLC
jgi:hypothetical protein